MTIIVTQPVQATYTCAVIGDGKTPETAFRPAINDVRTATGQPAFHHDCVIPVDPTTGMPTVATIDVTVLDNSHAALLAGNVNVTLAAAPLAPLA